jgi:hypothetical protein
MSRIVVCVALSFLSTLAMAQQEPQTNPRSADPNAPQQAAPQQSPQTEANPQDKSGVNSQMKSDISSALSSDPSLSGANVESSVDDSTITLTGTVQSQAQMDRVLALVSPYARYRNVVNKIVVH